MMNHNLKIRYYKDSDWNDISELLISKLFRTKERLLTFWKWQIEENPYVKDPNTHRIVVEDVDKNKAVAFLAYYRNKIIIKNKEYHAVSAMHYSTDDDYRGVGIALWIRFIRDNELCLTNLTNDERNVNKIKMKIMNGRIDMNYNYFYQYKLKRFFNRKLLCYIYKNSYHIINIFMSFRNKNTEKINIEKINAFEKDINLIFSEYNKYYKIFYKKTDEYLNWRYFKFPLKIYNAWVAYSNHKPVGYIVVGLVSGNMYIVDLQFSPRKKYVASCLILHVLRWGSDKNIQSAYFIYPPTPIVDIISQIGFQVSDRYQYCYNVKKPGINITFSDGFMGGYGDFEDGHYLMGYV